MLQAPEPVVSQSKRLAASFERAHAENRVAFIAFTIPGFPSLEESDASFDAMVAGGADVMEIEIPFSDPLADGSTIQRVAFEALKNGTTPSSCIDFVRRARGRHPEMPIVIMTYLNPVLAYGLERFAADASAAGADAMILVDLPPEEASEIRLVLAAAGLDLIFLVAPTSSDERLSIICSQGSGFIYCVSLTGVTGARENLPPGLQNFIARVRRCTALPLAVGFGISRREHVLGLTGVADGVIVGSALVDLLGKSTPENRFSAVRAYVEELTGRVRA